MWGARAAVTMPTTISRHQSRRDDADDLAAAYLLSTGSSDTQSRLRSFLNTTAALQLQPDTKFLKMCLLDTIHGSYIQALAMLPSDQQPRLLRAVLAGGHCYGVMEDPVSNIVVNSIWYSARFPHPVDDNDGDYRVDSLIKATGSMTRAESSSFHGLIAILRAGRGLTEQEAVACLCSNRHNLPRLTMSMTSSFAAAADAAKHPQPAALVAFLTTSLTPQKRDRLRALLTPKRALSDADFKELKSTIAGDDDSVAAPEPRMATTPEPCPTGFQFNNLMESMAVQTTVPDRRPQCYVRTKVEEVLLAYGRNNPLGPQYKLDLICGVESASWSMPRGGTECYHVNFLASTPAADATTSPTESKLFFAEFLDNAIDHFERSKKPPVCCPIQDYHAFPGRCFTCEWGSVTILHPPCGNYHIGCDRDSTDALCAVAERHADLGH